MSIFGLFAKSMILAGIMEKRQLAPTDEGDVYRVVNAVC